MLRSFYRATFLFVIIFLSTTLGLAVTGVDENILKRTMPAADSFNKKAIDGIEYFEAVKGADVIGYCIMVDCKGYSGSIRAMVGIDKKGVIQDVEILENSETPGFGTRINEAPFLGQFKGKNADTVSVGKNIDAVTGATVSSKTVTDAINKTVGGFMARLSGHQLQLRQK